MRVRFCNRTVGMFSYLYGVRDEASREAWHGLHLRVQPIAQAAAVRRRPCGRGAAACHLPVSHTIFCCDNARAFVHDTAGLGS
jgi:hypothetical protein